MPLTFEVDSRELNALDDRKINGAIARALRKAGSTALRDMRSEASKRIRARKRLKVGVVSRALVMRRAKGTDIDGLSWALNVRGTRVPLSAYPYKEKRESFMSAGSRTRSINYSRGAGVAVEVNKGKRTFVRSAFVATMSSGHQGIFFRRGARRLPIWERAGSRPVDALLHRGETEGVATRGQVSLAATFARLLPIELDKNEGGGGGGE